MIIAVFGDDPIRFSFARMCIGFFTCRYFSAQFPKLQCCCIWLLISENWCMLVQTNVVNHTMTCVVGQLRHIMCALFNIMCTCRGVRMSPCVLNVCINVMCTCLDRDAYVAMCVCMCALFNTLCVPCSMSYVCLYVCLHVCLHVRFLQCHVYVPWDVDVAMCVHVCLVQCHVCASFNVTCAFACVR